MAIINNTRKALISLPCKVFSAEREGFRLLIKWGKINVRNSLIFYYNLLLYNILGLCSFIQDYMICFGFILFNTIFIGAKSVAIYMLFESFFEEGQQFRYLIIFNNKLSMEIKKVGQTVCVK